jgi:hypothetical protein
MNFTEGALANNFTNLSTTPLVPEARNVDEKLKASNKAATNKICSKR